MVNVTFVSSGAAGAKSGTLSVTGNGSTQTVGLTGITTVAMVGFSAPTALFNPVMPNTAAVTGTITFKNTATGANAGSFTLTTAPTFAGPGAFSITGGTCAVGTPINPGGTLVPPAAGSSCTIIVQYIPSGTTPSVAHVTIYDTGAAAASQSFSFMVN